MRERRFILNIEQMLEGGEGSPLIREALERIDRKRREKALSAKNARAQVSGIGAGLLIQKALTEYSAECQAVSETGQPEGRKLSEDPGSEEKLILECFSVEELLSVLDREVTEPCYRYGKNGKPYLTDYPFQFNLSHSGDYVFCGVSKQEIGVDIQKIKGDHGMCLAKRFFAESERRALESCGDEEQRRRMFFRMWVRKEAYGKLTGEGIPWAVGKCLWSDVPAERELSSCSMGNGLWWEKDLIWEEYDAPGGYQTAVCRFRRETVSE